MTNHRSEVPAPNDLAKQVAKSVETYADVIIAIILVTATIIKVLTDRLTQIQEVLDIIHSKKEDYLKLTPEQDRTIKQLIREIVNTQGTIFSRCTLYQVNKPKIEKEYITAKDFTKWISASSNNSRIDIGEPVLSFALVSEELNAMVANKVNYNYYKDCKDGLFCAQWLKSKKVKSYLVYLLPPKEGEVIFLVCERIKRISLLSLLCNSDDNCVNTVLNYCVEIERIITADEDD